jgi:transposase
VVMRCLLGRAPVSDLFGRAGRAWLAERSLPEEEQETVAGCLRQVDFLAQEVAALDRKIAEHALAAPEIKRLMTIPGVDVGTAAALMAAVGDIRRFATPRQLVAYLGLDPKVRQSGEQEARHGHISKRGNAQARSLLVEAAWVAVRSPGPLRAFGERLRARRGAQVAAVAVARKLAVLAWHMLTKQQDYAFARPSLTRQKLRRLERAAGQPRLSTRHGGARVSATPSERQAERELQEQGERGYQRLVADWQASAKKKTGAGATPGRASQRPSERQAARQGSAPGPAL